VASRAFNKGEGKVKKGEKEEGATRAFRMTMIKSKIAFQSGGVPYAQSQRVAREKQGKNQEGRGERGNNKKKKKKRSIRSSLLLGAFFQIKSDFGRGTRLEK